MIKDIETNWAYLAGLVDGEGTFGVYSSGTRMSVANTYLPALEWCKDFVGAGHIVKNVHPNQRRQCYQWAIGAIPCREVLPRIIPYMIIKKAKAEVFLEYLLGIESRSAMKLSDAEINRRQVLVNRMRELT